MRIGRRLGGGHVLSSGRRARETMDAPRESLEPLRGAERSWRQRLGLKDELLLALLPTGTVLAVLGLLEAFSEQRLLFGSLASSAFLVYLDPLHTTNTVRTLVSSHLLAMCAGLVTFLLLGHGYLAAAAAMVTTIVLMVLLDVVHPPAVATSLIFALRIGSESTTVLFLFALGMTAGLVVLQHLAAWLLSRAVGRRIPGGPDAG